MNLRLSNIINRYSGQKEIYIIGTGPSLRVFPREFFQNKFTIGLNQIWEVLETTLILTIHPNCIPHHLNLIKNSKVITKVKKSESSWQLHEKANNLNKFYYFNNLSEWQTMEKPENRASETLYCGRGIGTAAMHLAAILAHPEGCNAYLVGCDSAQLAGDHNATGSHIQPHQYDINKVYKEYFFYLVKCREILEKNYNIRFFSLSHLLGEGNCREDDYIHQREQLGLEQWPAPKVIETNKRDTKLVTDFIN